MRGFRQDSGRRQEVRWDLKEVGEGRGEKGEPGRGGQREGLELRDGCSWEAGVME